MLFNWIKLNLLSTKQLYNCSAWLIPLLATVFFITLTIGLYGGLFIAPADYQQGDAFRIIYVHVPAALTAMSIYLVMTLSAILTLVFRIKTAAICMSQSAKIGVWFNLLALITGSLWGKPMWGTYWAWDARLTSVLILLFIYLGFITLNSVLKNSTTRDKITAIFAVIGSINLPIIHYSVIWWNTLHQGPSITQFKLPSIAFTMLWPLLVMIITFQVFYFWILLIRMRNQIYFLENKKSWLQIHITQLK